MAMATAGYIGTHGAEIQRWAMRKDEKLPAYQTTRRFGCVHVAMRPESARKVLAEMAGIKGLIIDIRLNPGGTDQCL